MPVSPTARVRPRRPAWSRLPRVGAVASGLTLALGGVMFVAPAAQAAAGSIETGSAPSAAVGSIDYAVYLPPNYDPAGAYPSVYLLHGRGDSMAAWQQMAGKLDTLITEGAVPPLIAVMPDAPWSERGNYYVDSLYMGAENPGAAVETAFTEDLLAHIDSTYATVDDRGARAVGGYSMGGAGAVRYATAHQDLFSAGLVLSPAVYVPTPPLDSSTREFGAYGNGASLFDEARYTSLAYPSTFAALDASLPIHLFIAVGDDEWANPLPEDAIHDLDYEAATLYNRAKRVTGITAELRVYDGGHDWDVWSRGFEEGMRDIGPRLRTTAPPAFPGSQIGSSGQDYAGGVLALADGHTITATNLAGDAAGHVGAGGLDILVQRLDASGAAVWSTAIAGTANDRAYGVVSDGEGGALIAGFARSAHDDMLVARVSADGDLLWKTTYGSTTAADRAYAVTSDGDGGAYLAGYTSGSLPGHTSAGDKDAALVHVDAAGSVTWSAGFGGAGEDKAYAVSTAPDGTVVVAGSSGGAMPGGTSAGSLDAWVAGFSPAGEQLWLHQYGTDASEQFQAAVGTPDGVIVAGYSGGSLAGTSAGASDMVAMAFNSAGEQLWQRQYGTSGDDRGAALVARSGGLALIGHSDGAWGIPAGGVDVVALPLTLAGVPGTPVQLGSAQRDGADEWDEASLFASTTGDSVWIQGVTFGAVDGAINQGLTDVFLSKVELESTGGPTSPETTTTTTSAPPTTTSSRSGSSAAAVPPVGGAGGGSGTGTAGGGVGGLSSTGVDALRALLAAAAITMVGAALVRRRRAMRPQLGAS